MDLCCSPSRRHHPKTLSDWDSPVRNRYREWNFRRRGSAKGSKLVDFEPFRCDDQLPVGAATAILVAFTFGTLSTLIPALPILLTLTHCTRHW